jgi:hypothetical protein
MASHARIIPGTVRNGVVVPEGDAPLPEGARVEIVLQVIDVTPQVGAAERAAADAEDEAGARTVDQWEREE